MFDRSDKEIFYVYCFQYKQNGESMYYIGQTMNLLQRLSAHRCTHRKPVEICGLKIVKTREIALEIELIITELYNQYGEEVLCEAFITAGGCWAHK